MWECICDEQAAPSLDCLTWVLCLFDCRSNNLFTWFYRRKTRTKQAMDRGCKKNKVTFKDDNNNSNRNINSTFEVVKETQASHRRPDPFSELSFSLGSIDLDVSDVDSQHESMDQMSGDVGSVNRAVVKPRVMNGVTRMGLSPLTPSTISPASSPGSSDPSFSDIKTSTPVIGVPVGKPAHLTMLQWVYAKDKVWPSMSAAEVEALSDADWIDYFNQHLDEFPKTHYTFPDCVWYRPITGKKWFIKPNMSNWAGTQPGPHKPLRKFCCYTSKRYIKGVCCDRHGDDESEEDIPSQMGFQSTQNQNYPAVEDMRASSRMSHRMGPSPLDYKMYDSEVSPQSPSSFRSQSRNYKKSNRSYHRQSSHYETPDLSFNSPVVDHKTREAKILYTVIIALAAFFAYLAFQNPECFVK